jgi:hypothetical protein
MRRQLFGSFVFLLAAFVPTFILTSCSGLSSRNQAGSGSSKTVPALAWPTPSPVTNPTPLSSTQLDATANVPGTFVYTPAAGSVLPAGTQTLTVTFTPTDTGDYHTAAATVSIVVNPAKPDAYVYVSTKPDNNDNVEIYDYSAASDGTLTAVVGSPFSASTGVQATNGKYLFGSNGVDIYSFSVASDGTFQQVASINAQQFNSQSTNGSYCGNPGSPFLDRTGTNLYDLDYDGNVCANNQYQSFSVDSSIGNLTYLGSTSAATPIFDVPLSFSGNNQYAYGGSCYHWYQEIFGFVRNSDGTLAALSFDPIVSAPMPASNAGQIYCPYLAAADSANHVAVPVQALDNATLLPVGPMQLATYTSDASGNLTTSSTYSNMPAMSVTNSSNNYPTAISMSPSNQLLAIGGSAGLQVFHFNGANPIMPYTNVLTTDEVDSLFWDNDNHLYALAQSGAKLFVFTITPTSQNQASGSPYTLTNPGSLVVLPE